MAYNKVKNEEHAYQRIQKDIKDDRLGSALFFYGKELYLINWALEVIVNKYVNVATRELDFSQLDPQTTAVDEIIAACETFPMMSARKVVLIRDFKVLEGGKLKGFSEDGEKKLAEYIKSVPESTMLIFTAEGADRRKKLYKAIDDAGQTYDFSALDPKQLKGFIEKRLKSAGRYAKPAAVAQFIDHTGYYDKETDYTLYNLENDLKKALAFSQNPELSADDLVGTVAGNIDTNVFAMMDALSQNNKSQAFVYLNNILNSGESIYKILALICSQFELMLSAKEMQEEGFALAHMTKQLAVHEFRVKKALQFARGYSVKQLRKAALSAYEVDKNIKTGLLPQTLALEMFIASI